MSVEQSTSVLHREAGPKFSSDKYWTESKDPCGAKVLQMSDTKLAAFIISLYRAADDVSDAKIIAVDLQAMVGKPQKDAK